MKKKIIIVSILIILIIILLIIPRDVYKKIFKRDSPNVQEELPIVYQTMFVKNQNKQLVGIKVPVASIEEDVISQKWDLLTSEATTLPNGYNSPIVTSTLLKGYTEENNILTLEVTEDFLLSEGRLAIECLAWNFCNETINEIKIKIEDEVINEVNNYYFNKISKAIGVNFIFETNYLYEAEYVTIIYYDDETIRPVTYFYENQNYNDYLFNKVLKTEEELIELVNNKLFTYEINEDAMVINLEYQGTLDENLIKTLTETIKYNYNINKIKINGLESVLLELDFTS